MLLENNSKKVIDLIKEIDLLSNVDKIRLAIIIFERPYITINFDIDNIITTLKDILKVLDPEYTKTIINFSKYKNLILLSSKYMELSYKDKERLSVELLFNIFETDFKDDTINNKINNELNVYDYGYSLNIM